MAFVDEHRDRFGVEPICRVLREHDVKIAPSTQYAAKSRPPSERAQRDEVLKVEIQRVYDDNFVVYGADKIWDHLNNEDHMRVARCTVERLMRDLQISGVRRGRSWVRTTITDGPGYTTPAAHEAAYYAQQLSGHQAETQTIESP